MPARKTARSTAGKLLYVTKMTPKVVDTIVTAIERQAAPETAAAMADVSPRTLRRWLADGREWLEAHDDDEIPTPEAVFVIRVEKAIEHAKQSLIDGMVEAKDARINLEILQRRHPREWGKRERIDIGQPEDQMWELATKDLSFLPLEDIRHLQRIMRAISEHRAGGDVIEMRPRELEA